MIDTKSQKHITQIAVGKGRAQVGFTLGRRQLFVANRCTSKKPCKTVNFINLATFKLVTALETELGANRVVVDPERRHAAVTNTYGNTVSVIDLAQSKIIAAVAVGKGSNGISILP